MSAATATSQRNNNTDPSFGDYNHADAVRALGICWLSKCLKPEGMEVETFQDVIDALASLRVKRKFNQRIITEDAARNVALVELSEQSHIKSDINNEDLVHVLKLDNASGGSFHEGDSSMAVPVSPAVVDPANGNTPRSKPASGCVKGEVTVSHILGEAFELFCAISFKERIVPLVLQDRPELPPSARTMCKVEKVFLSDSVSKEELKWIDQKPSEGDAYARSLVENFIEGRNSDVEKEAAAERFVNTLIKNIDKDKGFDIVVQLKETDTDKIHFILAQCKFRSDQDSPTGMAATVGKHFDIAEQARTVEGVLCPMHWIATNRDFEKAEAYFSKLIQSGLLVIQGASALIVQT